MSDNSPSLVGRRSELQNLVEAHEEVADVGRMVLVSAEAGGGKTGLVSEFLRRLPASCPAGLGAAVDIGDENAPMLPIRLAISDLEASVERGGRSDDATGGRKRAGPSPWDGLDLDLDRSMLSVFEVLATAPIGAVLVLEDLHWADSASLAFLRTLASRLRSLPLLVLVTFRSDIPRSHPLRATIGEVSRQPGVHRLALEPLSRAEIGELYIQHHQEPPDQLTLDQLVLRTGGNPFYVVEAIGADPAVVPLSVEDALVHRLEQLPSAVLDVVRAAAIAGPVMIDDLAAVSPVEAETFADALRGAVEANIVAIDDEQVRFRHDLLAEAVLQTVLPFETRAVHRQLAERLHRADLEDTLDNLTRLATHWHLAGDAERAFSAADRAAERATAQRFFAVAFVHLSVMLELWDAIDEPVSMVGRERHLVLLQTAEVASELGRTQEAVRLGRQAFDSVADDPAARADAAWRYGYLLYTARQLTEARRLIRVEVERVIDAAPRREFARLLVADIGIAMSLGDYEVGVDCDQRVITMVDQVDDLVSKGRLASFRGACLTASGAVTDGMRMLDEAIELLTRAEDHAFAANACLTRVLAGFVAEPLDDLLVKTARGLDQAEKAPPSRHMALAGLHAELLHYAGRTIEAWQVFEAGSTRLAWRTAAERALTLGTLALDAADLETARRLVESADIAAAAHNPPMALRAEILRCRLLAVDDPDRAGVELLEAVDRAAGVSIGLHAGLALTHAWEWATESCSWRDDLATATDRVFERSYPAVEQSPVGAWRALLAAHASTSDLAAWEHAVDVCRLAAMRNDEGRALLGSAAACLASGERASAARFLDRADQLATEVDNSILGEAAGALRRRGRLGSGIVSTAGDLGLTAREAEVFELLAGGHTNKEIAERLFISAKTASVHVTNLLRKLAVSNRREAGRLARDLGLG